MLDKIRSNSIVFFGMVILVAILLMSVGFATINTITMEITGNAEAQRQNGIYIYDVTDVSNSGASAEIVNYTSTTMHSIVTLSASSGSSYITKCVKIYNNTDQAYFFDGVIYDSSYYSNAGITFETSNFNIGDKISAGESKEIYITFKYANNTVASSNQLDSYLNFSFTDILQMTVASTNGSTTYTGQPTSGGAKVEVTKPESGYTITYGTTEGNYTLSSMPTYTNVGTYTVYYQVTATDYETVKGSLTITIAKADSTLTAPTAKLLEYTGSAQELINAGSTSCGTIQYKLGDGKYGTSIPTATDAGTYTVYYKVVGDSNHNDSAEQSLTVTIEPIYTITYTTGDMPYTPSSGKTSFSKLTSTITLDTPTATGYTFQGWYDNSSCTGTAVTQIAQGTTGNISLWAKWTFTGYSYTETVQSSGTYTMMIAQTVSAAGTVQALYCNPSFGTGTYESDNSETADVVEKSGSLYLVPRSTNAVWTVVSGGTNYTITSSSGKYLAMNSSYSLILESSKPSSGTDWRYGSATFGELGLKNNYGRLINKWRYIYIDSSVFKMTDSSSSTLAYTYIQYTANSSY